MPDNILMSTNSIIINIIADIFMFILPIFNIIYILKISYSNVKSEKEFKHIFVEFYISLIFLHIFLGIIFAGIFFSKVFEYYDYSFYEELIKSICWNDSWLNFSIVLVYLLILLTYLNLLIWLYFYTWISRINFEVNPEYKIFFSFFSLLSTFMCFALLILFSLLVFLLDAYGYPTMWTVLCGLIFIIANTILIFYCIIHFLNYEILVYYFIISWPLLVLLGYAVFCRFYSSFFNKRLRGHDEYKREDTNWISDSAESLEDKKYIFLGIAFYYFVLFCITNVLENISIINVYVRNNFFYKMFFEKGDIKKIFWNDFSGCWDIHFIFLHINKEKLLLISIFCFIYYLFVINIYNKETLSIQNRSNYLYLNALFLCFFIFTFLIINYILCLISLLFTLSTMFLIMYNFFASSKKILLKIFRISLIFVIISLTCKIFNIVRLAMYDITLLSTLIPVDNYIFWIKLFLLGIFYVFVLYKRTNKKFYRNVF